VNAWTDGRPQLVNELIRNAAYRNGILPSEVLCDSHYPAFVRARREVMQTLRRSGYSLTRIGKVLGGLHHSTVLHHLQSVPQAPPAPAFNPDVPDESGIWAI
jgi:chromosomal replication initiation ATPase DnaA